MDAKIAGWDHTPFGALDQSFDELIKAAAAVALEMAGVEPAGSDSIWLGHFSSVVVPNAFASSLVLGSDDRLRLAPATGVENAEEADINVNDLDLAEVHDCFTIAELMIYEAMDLTQAGQGATAIADGTVLAEGRLPIDHSGGQKAKGHTFGATGVSMHVTAAQQVTGQAGPLQKAGAELAAVYNMGGSGVASYCSIPEAPS